MPKPKKNKPKRITLPNQPKTSLTIKKINPNSIAIIKHQTKYFDTDNSWFIQHKDDLIDLSFNPYEITKRNLNYFYQRYYFFSRFDHGIQMDEESWYSVTPEEIAKYIASVVKDSESSSITDAFCGCGGNTIHFSSSFKTVNAIDISATKLNITKNNTHVYECKDNINFIECDYWNYENKSDYVFLSPPWGGADYKKDDQFELKKWIYPDIELIIQHSLKLSRNWIFYLPRNTNVSELIKLIYKNKHSSYPEEGEDDDNVDDNLFWDIRLLYSANKVKAIWVLYGDKFNSVTVKDMKDYVKLHCKGCSKDDIKTLVDISKIIGACTFLNELYFYSKREQNDFNTHSLRGEDMEINENNNNNDNNDNSLSDPIEEGEEQDILPTQQTTEFINYCKNTLLTEEEFQSLTPQHNSTNNSPIKTIPITNISCELTEDQFNKVIPQLI